LNLIFFAELHKKLINILKDQDHQSLMNLSFATKSCLLLYDNIADILLIH